LRINKIAAATALAVLTSGAAVASAETAANAATRSPNATLVGFGTATPATNLTNGQTISMSVTGFPAADAGQTMYVFQCAEKALSTLNQGYCDVNPDDSNNTAVFGASTGGSTVSGTATFKVLTGSSFKPTIASSCAFSPKASDESNTCYVVVADSQDGTVANVSPAGISFKDTRAKSFTAIKAPKTAKKGKTLKYTVGVAGTSTAKATGKVTIKDGSKKIETDKIPSSGVLKVKVKEKKISKGKHKLKATYPGDDNYKKSSAKVTVKVK
jgi:hypothetical protein